MSRHLLSSFSLRGTLDIRSSVRRLSVSAFAVMLMATPSEVQAQVGASQGVKDINTIAEQELARLPGMTPALAKSVVEKRPFTSMTEVDALLGATLAKEQRVALYPSVFLHINLNTASREDILLVPGIGNRMLREFIEYRPYKAITQFRREMGKYVDDKEVARMEQYVFVPIDLNTASDADILTIPGLGNRMLREFKEYRPYKSMEQFRREIGKYVNAKELARLERYVEIR
jgi:DNA uptake protein ComE-like DNA-binding protein